MQNSEIWSMSESGGNSWARTSASDLLDHIDDIDGLLPRLLVKAVQVTKSEQGVLYIVDCKQQAWQIAHYSRRHDSLERSSKLVNAIPLTEVIQSGKEMIFCGEGKVPTGTLAKSYAYVPLRNGARIMGVFYVYNVEETNHYDVNILEQLKLLAKYGSVSAEIQSRGRRAVIGEILEKSLERLNRGTRLEEVLDCWVNGITDRLGFDYSTISLVDRVKSVIKTVSGAGTVVSDEWLAHSLYPLDHDDIQADVVRTGKVEILYEWDDRLNREIWEKCEHERLVRIFLPIRNSQDLTIGTLEAGYEKSNRRFILWDEVDTLGTLISHIAATIQNWTLNYSVRMTLDSLTKSDQSPRHTLETIGTAAIRSLGADLVQIYEYDEDYHSEDFHGIVLPPTQVGKQFADHIPTNSYTDDAVTRVIKSNSVLYYSDVREAEEFSAPFMVQAENRPRQRFVDRERIVAVAAAPLKAGNKCVGAMFLSFRYPQIFPESTKELVRFFSEQSAAAIYNAQLTQRLQSYAEALRVLHKIGNRIAHQAIKLDKTALLEHLYGEYGDLLDAENFYISLYNPNNNQIFFPFVVEKGVRVPSDGVWSPRELSDGLTEEVIRRGEALLIPSNVEEWYRNNPEVNLWGRMPKSWLGAPAQIGGRVLGVIAVQSYDRDNAFNTTHKDLLEAMATQAAIVIEYSDVRDQANNLIELISQLTQAYANERELLDTVLIEAIDLLNCVAGAFIIQEGNELVVYSVWTDNDTEWLEQRFPVENGGIVSQAILEKKMKWASGDAVKEHSRFILSSSTKSMVTAPLTAGDRVVGVLRLESRDRMQFSSSSARNNELVEILAEAAGSAIHTLRLEEDERRARDYRAIADNAVVAGVLAHGMVHEIANGINTADTTLYRIRGVLSSIQNLKGQNDYLTTIDETRIQLEELDKHTADLRRLSFKREPRRKRIEFNNIIQSAIVMLEGVIKQHNLTLETHFDPKLHRVTVIADEDQLKRVVINLTLNAIDAAFGAHRRRDANTSDALSTKTYGKLIMSTKLSPTGAQFYIQDFGAGIAAADKPHLFKPFYTTKKDGTGLGLYISRIIIEDNHHGHLYFQSKEGKGSTFWFTLPLAPSTDMD